MDRYSSFTRLKRITAWVFRFIHNCRTRRHDTRPTTDDSLTVPELLAAENHWLLISQREHFSKEVETIADGREIPDASCLLPLRPFLDSSNLIRVGGRLRDSELPYHSQHPVVLHGKNTLTKLIVHSEHLRLLHAGPTLLASSL